MHILGLIIAILVAMDVTFGAIRVVGAMRRQRFTDASGNSATEPLAAYVTRLMRAAAPAVLILLVVVVGFWVIVHFGPLRPIHEWRK